MVRMRGLEPPLPCENQEFLDEQDTNVLMLARIYGRRLKGYADMGYQITRDTHQQNNN